MSCKNSFMTCTIHYITLMDYTAPRVARLTVITFPNTGESGLEIYMGRGPESKTVGVQ